MLEYSLKSRIIGVTPATCRGDALADAHRGVATHCVIAFAFTPLSGDP